MNTQPWKIQAKIDPPEPDMKSLDEPGLQALLERLRQRVQSLMEERFQLKCHAAVKELPTYELVAAKGGARLSEAAPGKRQHSISSNGVRGKTDLDATGITMAELSARLSSEVGRTVTDKTGLAGLYDVRLSWTSAMAASQDIDAGSAPTLFTALEEQVGLKLVPARGPVQVLVIDSVQKPSED